MIILGKVNALVYLTMSWQSATAIISLLSGVKPTELTAEGILNGTANILQKVDGKAKKLLTGMNVQWDISTPNISVGYIREDIHLQQNKLFSILKKYRAGDVVVTYRMYFL